MDLLVTNAGITAVASANGAGPKVDLTSFKTGDASGYTPNAVDTALHGSQTYVRGISNYYRLSADEVVYILQVEVGSAIDFGEVAIYTSGGALFALAAFPALKSKDAGELVEIEAHLKLNGIATAITFDIPSFADARLVELTGVTQLNRPDLSASNAYLTHSYDEGGRNPIVAYRHDDDTWDFPTHCVPVVSSGVVTAGSSTTVINTNSITGFVETAPSFTPGKYLIQFKTGALRGTARIINSVTATTITVSAALGSSPVTADTFEIVRSLYSMVVDRFVVDITLPYTVRPSDRRKILAFTGTGDVTMPLASTMDPTFSLTLFNNSPNAIHINMSGGDTVTALGSALQSTFDLPEYGGAAEMLPKGSTAWLPLMYESSLSGSSNAPNTGYQYVEYQKSGPFVVPASITLLQTLTAGHGGNGGDGAVRCGGGAGFPGQLKTIGSMWHSYANDQVYDNWEGIPVTPGETLTVEIDGAGSRLKRGSTVLLESLMGAAGAAGIDPGASPLFDSPMHQYSLNQFLGSTYDGAADAIADSAVYKINSKQRRPLLCGAGGPPIAPSIVYAGEMLVPFTAAGLETHPNSVFSSTVNGVGSTGRPGFLYGAATAMHPWYGNFTNLTLVNGRPKVTDFAGVSPLTGHVSGYIDANDQTIYATGTGWKGWTPYRPGMDGLQGCNGFGHLGGGGGAGCDNGFTPGAGGIAGKGYVLLGWHGDVPGYPYYNRSSIRPWLLGTNPSTLISGSNEITIVDSYPYELVSPLIAASFDQTAGPESVGMSGTGFYNRGNSTEGPMMYAVHDNRDTSAALFMIGVNAVPGVVFTLEHLAGTISGVPMPTETHTSDTFGVVYKKFTDTAAFSADTHIFRWSFTAHSGSYDGTDHDNPHVLTLLFKFTVL